MQQVFHNPIQRQTSAAIEGVQTMSEAIDLLLKISCYLIGMWVAYKVGYQDGIVWSLKEAQKSLLRSLQPNRKTTNDE